jgi:hypothetical protein
MDWLLELPDGGYLLPVVQQETAEMHLHSTTIKCVMNSSISSSSSGKVGSGEFGRIIEERIPVGEEVFLMGYVKQLVQWDNTHVGGGGANRHRRMIFGNSADATAVSYRVQKPLIQLYLISTMSERDLSRWLGRRWLAGSAIGLLFYLWAAIVQIKLQNIR